MIERLAAAGPAVDHGPPPAIPADLFTAFAAGTSEDPGDMWNGIARTACAIAQARRGGAVLGNDRRLAGMSSETGPIAVRAIDALVKRLRKTPRCATWIDGDTSTMYAAAAIAGNPDTGFLWVERTDAPFHWREASDLHGVAALASLLELLERQRDHADLLLREYRHRLNNDVQLVGSMLSLRARSAASREARDSINDAADRLRTLAAARSESGDLIDTLRRLCATMSDQVTARNVMITMNVRGLARDVDVRRRGVALIAANELLTNAIKHAFGDDGGVVTMAVGGDLDRLMISVSDDGGALAPGRGGRAGSGLDLIGRILAGIGGRLRLPDGDKTFVIEIPLRPARP